MRRREVDVLAALRLSAHDGVARTLHVEVAQHGVLLAVGRVVRAVPDRVGTVPVPAERRATRLEYFGNHSAKV